MFKEKTGLFYSVSVYDSREIIYGEAMRKIISVIVCICLMVFFAGCSAEKTSTKKLRDIDFTVVDEENIPKELEDMIEDKEEEMFKLILAVWYIKILI